MSNGLFDVNQSTARHELAAPEFFYSNLRIQETLTTIRYGIEARKGLIIITGAPGVGKSTLLRKAATELGADTACVFESDPRVSFSDILRLLLRNLDKDQADDESAMVRRCRLQLRARLDQCQIVALFLDNAHQFSDQTLRAITQAFLAGSAEDPEGTLLQVILAGRTELKPKISRAMLTWRRKSIVCELQPLNSGEIAAFIEAGLKSSNRPVDIFDERAIKRIALYANGYPSTINSICERALQLADAGGSTDAKIPAELIESAASDPNLRRFDNSSDSKIFSPPSDSLEFEIPKPSEKFDYNEQDIPYKFSADKEVSSAPIFPPRTAEVDGVNWRPRKRQTTTWLRGLALLVILVGAAAVLRTDIAMNVVRNGVTTLNQIAAPNLPSAAQPRIPGEILSEGTIKTEPLAPLPGPDRPVEIYQGTPGPSAGKIDPPAQRRPATKLNAGQHETLQTQITKAIENRAIMGIEVSVVQGTAYLDGHVASERQRRAAERAARSVAGVERVRNRIAITFG